MCSQRDLGLPEKITTSTKIFGEEDSVLIAYRNGLCALSLFRYCISDPILRALNPQSLRWRTTCHQLLFPQDLRTARLLEHYNILPLLLCSSIFEPRNVRESLNAWTCTRHVLLQVSCAPCLVEKTWLPHSMSNVWSIVASSVWASALVKEQPLPSLCRWPNPICNTRWCHTCCALVRWSGCLCLSTAPRSRNLACTSRNMHTHTLVAEEDGTGTNQAHMLVTGYRPWTLGATPRQLKNLSPSGNHATTNYDWRGRGQTRISFGSNVVNATGAVWFQPFPVTNRQSAGKESTQKHNNKQRQK